MYETSPVQQVVGEFEVRRVIADSVDNLWESTQEWAGIDERRFLDYFSGKDSGFAIEIGTFRQYEEPLCIERHLGVSPPQSFQYLDSSWPLCLTNQAA